MSVPVEAHEASARELSDELDCLTGHRRVAGVSLSLDQIKAFEAEPSSEATQAKSILRMAMSVARVASVAGYSKGWNAGQRSITSQLVGMDVRAPVADVAMEAVCEACHATLGVMPKAEVAAAYEMHMASSQDCAGAALGFNRQHRRYEPDDAGAPA